jgi:thiol:disulfide interchange protein
MRIILSIVFILLPVLLTAQIADPVTWKADIRKADEHSVIIALEATLEKNWHIYSQFIPDGGPVKTTIGLSDESLAPLSWFEDGSAIHSYDSAFQLALTYYSRKVRFLSTVSLSSFTDSLYATVVYMVCDEEACLPPEEKVIPLRIPDLATLATASEHDLALLKAQTPNGMTAENNAAQHSSPSLWGVFVTAFFGGLAALLTPCVFPIIPLTVTYFTKRNQTRKQTITGAVFFGASIILIYVSLGYGVTLLFGIDAVNALATNVWINLFFFAVLVVFAASFLGAFEITLPSAFVNKVDSHADRGGVIGIFFMAFTLALVSFSCTGPIIGTLLFESAVSGNMNGPLIGMTGFSLALALPFMVFAAFPAWIKALPKSGGWLNSVKVVLGFLELALALKFLSNADLVVQAGMLTREIFIAVWIAISATLTLYLLGFIRFPHDSVVSSLSITRAIMAMLALAFTLYLLPGLWGAPLNLISGFAPPDFYTEWNKTPAAETTTEHKNGCPNGLNCFHDYHEALAFAKTQNKPVLVDFTGWACVNCRKMESTVWTDIRVDSKLRNDVVLASLYVDDKRELPPSDQTTAKMGDRDFRIRTIGNKWSYLQANRFKINSQPFYVLLDHNEEILNIFAGYKPSVPEFEQFLEEGIGRFHKR